MTLSYDKTVIEVGTGRASIEMHEEKIPSYFAGRADDRISARRTDAYDISRFECQRMLADGVAQLVK